jgi:hypothetical protein
MADSRQHAHHLIDCLPDSQVSALVGLLETIIDPIGTALRDAPLDDEPETDAERQDIEKARRSLERNGGKGIPHEEAMRRIGLD